MRLTKKVNKMNIMKNPKEKTEEEILLGEN